MNTRSTSLTHTVGTRYWVSTFNLSGGLRIYQLDGSSYEMHLSLPPPVAGTELLIYHGGGTNACYVCSSSAAPIWNLTDIEIELAQKGEFIELFADPDGTKWVPRNLTNVII